MRAAGRRSVLTTRRAALAAALAAVAIASLSWSAPPASAEVVEGSRIARDAPREIAGVRPYLVPSAEEEAVETAPEPRAWSVDWDALARCESHGEWDYGPHSGWGSGIYEGGLQFHPNTWDSYREPGMPNAAYLATPGQQKAVAEAVLGEQGLRAWPACTRKLGWR